jgi:hypothetical protein
VQYSSLTLLNRKERNVQGCNRAEAFVCHFQEEEECVKEAKKERRIRKFEGWTGSCNDGHFI